MWYPLLFLFLLLIGRNALCLSGGLRPGEQFKALLNVFKFQLISPFIFESLLNPKAHHRLVKLLLHGICFKLVQLVHQVLVLILAELGPIPYETRDLFLGRLLLVNFGEDVFILLNISNHGLLHG